MQNSKDLLEQINDLLPQTQCGLCTYQGCRPYAEAIALHNEQINRCPPGGLATLNALAKLLEIDVKPLQTQMVTLAKPAMQAKIREDECIGCTKCIQACPVDAIIGGAKQMHTVLLMECTGCELCVAPCPVDCIDMLELPEPLYEPAQAKQRYEARIQRLTLEKSIKVQQTKPSELANNLCNPINARQEAIQAALARVKEKKLIKE
ncbi:MAG: rnfB [Gammaproteobacteria bacterium]|jgi:electron transport complex protein RnfB|nr:rnfB [Gammaproteobacteria bacterium]